MMNVIVAATGFLIYVMENAAVLGAVVLAGGKLIIMVVGLSM